MFVQLVWVVCKSLWLQVMMNTLATVTSCCLSTAAGQSSAQSHCGRISSIPRCAMNIRHHYVHHFRTLSTAKLERKNNYSDYTHDPITLQNIYPHTSPSRICKCKRREERRLISRKGTLGHEFPTSSGRVPFLSLDAGTRTWGRLKKCIFIHSFIFVLLSIKRIITFKTNCFVGFQVTLYMIWKCMNCHFE